MKKILILLKHLSLGGAEKMFIRILTSIDSSIYCIHVILVFDERIQELPQLPNLTVTSLFTEKTDLVKQLIREQPDKIYKENITGLYDVEIAFLEGYPTRIISASPNPNSLKIAFIHTDFRFFHHSLNAYTNSDLEEVCYQKYACLMFVSATAYEGFHTVYPSVSPKREVIYYPPLSEKMLLSSHNTIDTYIEMPYFITLTRLASEKGIFKLIDACKKIVELGYNICFKLYGSGPLYNDILQKVQSNSLEKYIHLLGYHSNPYFALKNSLAYICPSDNESFCIAIEEALFLSIPIIACRCPGTEEILHNGDFGLLVNNDSEGLFNGIYQFLSTPDMPQLLAQKSHDGKNIGKPFCILQVTLVNIFHQTRISK